MITALPSDIFTLTANQQAELHAHLRRRNLPASVEFSPQVRSELPVRAGRPGLWVTATLRLLTATASPGGLWFMIHDFTDEVTGTQISKPPAPVMGSKRSP